MVWLLGFLFHCQWCYWRSWYWCIRTFIDLVWTWRAWRYSCSWHHHRINSIRALCYWCPTSPRLKDHSLRIASNCYWYLKSSCIGFLLGQYSSYLGIHWWCCWWNWIWSKLCQWIWSPWVLCLCKYRWNLDWKIEQKQENLENYLWSHWTSFLPTTPYPWIPLL